MAKILPYVAHPVVFPPAQKYHAVLEEL